MLGAGIREGVGLLTNHSSGGGVRTSQGHILPGLARIADLRRKARALGDRGGYIVARFLGWCLFDGHSLDNQRAVDIVGGLRAMVLQAAVPIVT